MLWIDALRDLKQQLEPQLQQPHFENKLQLPGAETPDYVIACMLYLLGIPELYGLYLAVPLLDILELPRGLLDVDQLQRPGDSFCLCLYVFVGTPVFFITIRMRWSRWEHSIGKWMV